MQLCTLSSSASSPSKFWRDIVTFFISMVTTSCFYRKTSLAHLLACSWADTTWHDHLHSHHQKFSCSVPQQATKGGLPCFSWAGPSSSDTNWMISLKSYTKIRYPYKHYRSPSHYLMWLTINSCTFFLTLASSHHLTS